MNLGLDNKPGIDTFIPKIPGWENTTSAGIARYNKLFNQEVPKYGDFYYSNPKRVEEPGHGVIEYTMIPTGRYKTYTTSRKALRVRVFYHEQDSRIIVQKDTRKKDFIPENQHKPISWEEIPQDVRIKFSEVYREIWHINPDGKMRTSPKSTREETKKRRGRPRKNTDIQRKEAITDNLYIQSFEKSYVVTKASENKDTIKNLVISEDLKSQIIKYPEPLKVGTPIQFNDLPLTVKIIITHEMNKS